MSEPFIKSTLGITRWEIKFRFESKGKAKIQIDTHGKGSLPTHLAMHLFFVIY